MVSVTDEQSAQGTQSMKLLDQDMAAVYATRMIPSIRSGKVGASLYVPSDNTVDYVMELKAGYKYVYMQHTIAAFVIKPTGEVYTAKESGRVVVGKVDLDSWNDFYISFDMAAETGTLHINGEAVGEVPVMSHKGNEVTAVEFSAPTHDSLHASALYVDNFFVTELESAQLSLSVPKDLLPPVDPADPADPTDPDPADPTAPAPVAIILIVLVCVTAAVSVFVVLRRKKNT